MFESTFNRFLGTGSGDHEKDADALLLTCIDYRYTPVIPQILMREPYAHLKFDHVALAGASLSVFAGIRPQWASTFWEHLDVAIDLHQIKTVLILDHRDCGAYREFHALPSPPKESTPAYEEYLAEERQAHFHYMKRLAAFIEKLHPRMEVLYDLLEVPKKGDFPPCPPPKAAPPKKGAKKS